MLPTTSDKKIGELIADALLESDRQPYCFSINHDTRPPKCEACSFQYHWALKDRVGIETMDRAYARMWIAEVTWLGKYTVTPAEARGSKKHHSTGSSMSIDSVRRRAEYHQRPKSEHDDDIPF